MRRSEADMMHRGSDRMSAVLKRAGASIDKGVGRRGVELGDDVDQQELCGKQCGTKVKGRERVD